MLTTARTRPLEVAAADPAGPLSILAMRNLRMMHTLEWIAAAFDRAGIPLMVLKGAALYLTLYERPDRRAMDDLDLLVKPVDVDRAVVLLEQLGYHRNEVQFREDFFPRYYYEIEYVSWGCSVSLPDGNGFFWPGADGLRRKRRETPRTGGPATHRFQP